MLYTDVQSINSFLDEMIDNYSRLVDVAIMKIDNDILLMNVGARDFKLDSRLKTKSYKIAKRKTIYNMCYNLKAEYISREEAIKNIEAIIRDFESEVN